MGGLEYTFKIVLVGEPGVGKTSIIRRYIQGIFEEKYRATVGTRIFTKELDVDDRHVTLSIFEIGGPEKFRFGENVLYKGADGAVIVFDITSDGSFQVLDDWFAQTESNLGGEVPLVLVGNKYDLGGSRRVQKQEALSYASSHGAEYLESSAKTGKNVMNLFYSLILKILNSQKQGS
ncbi:MAG: Rab family GTPase [Candidatus Freyarchaeum deiterrae]